MLKNDLVSFEKLGLKHWLVKQLTSLGVKNPTPVQKGCVPSILSGKDCVGGAKTGSGKTFAFALPILQHLSDDPYGIFALILTPTHELAHQIAEQFSILGQPLNLRVCLVTGGTDQLVESQKLAKRPHVVVAMPGRLAAHLDGCDTFTLMRIKYLVIDEADRMFSGSFDEDLETILSRLPQKKQTLLFSATINEQITETKLLQLDKENLTIWTESDPEVTVETLDQRFVLCPAYARDVYMVETIRTFRNENEDGNIMIFTDKKKDCQLLSVTLNTLGMENVCLHGYMKQRDRVASLTQFRSKIVTTLVSTNVAARGLDIPAVQLVINHKLPKESKEYIHRVGRTARAGRSGLAISLITPHDLTRLAAIEEIIGTKLTEYKIDDREAVKIFTQVSVTKREAEVNLDNEDFDERAKNYRHKKWIEKGLDPDFMEASMAKMRKKRIKEAKERKFKNVQAERRLKKSQEISAENPTNGDCVPIEMMDVTELEEESKKETSEMNRKVLKSDKRFKNAHRKVKKLKKEYIEGKI